MSQGTSVWDRRWFSEDGSLLRLGVFRIAVMGLCLLDLIAYGATALDNAANFSAGTIERVWQPIYLFEVLGLGPIGIDAAGWVYGTALVACSLGMLGLFSRTACLVGGVLVLYWTGLVYSYGKVHHEKVALAFTLIALPFSPCGARVSLDAWLRRLRVDALSAPEHDARALWPIRLCMISITIGYAASGWTKLAIAGPEWANGYSLMGILMHYEGPLSATLGGSVWLAQLLSIAALALQIGFPLILVFPVLRWVWLPATVGFHLTTWLAMDTGPYITLWFLLIAFMPLEQIPAWFQRAWRSGIFSRALAATCLAAPTILVVYVASHYFPWWSSFLLLPPLWSLSLPLLYPERLKVEVPASRRRWLATAAALDWGGRFEFVTGDELRLTDEAGNTRSGPDARRLIRGRLALPIA